jgi:hypothetical protein
MTASSAKLAFQRMDLIAKLQKVGNLPTFIFYDRNILPLSSLPPLYNLNGTSLGPPRRETI